MLETYLARTRNLLQNPAAPIALYSNEDLTSWINQGRGQLAGEGRCVRAIGTIPTVAGQRVYDLADIDTGIDGIAGVLNIRSIQYGVGDGQKWVTARGWTWFNYYHMNNPVPEQGFPMEWAQLAPGAGGKFYLDPIPDGEYTLYCDSICYPVDLVDDTTPEAIPYLWTDAVPYFAAYLAYLSAQAPARQNDAARMFEHYTTFVERARDFATPDVNSYMYPQSKDPAQLGKLGLAPKK